ncbi:unnamed protein product [Penicillium glandicola]
MHQLYTLPSTRYSVFNPLQSHYLQITNHKRPRTMAQRAFHGTYEEERRYFMTTLHAQIHILKANHKGTRKMVINSLGLLLLRVEGLRMSGQAHFKRDNTSWTSKCNQLHGRVQYFRDTLAQDRNSTGRVANDIESMMLFLDFCVPENVHYRIQPDRGDRSGAPSPEPRR